MEKHTKLPEEFKKKWVKALLSKRFKQGDNRLYRKANNSYCCLGVACIVSGMDKNQIKRAIFIPRAESYNVVPNVLKGKNTITQKLANMNDSGSGFKKIASWIEKNL